mmetsp:Transcript_3/g.3  ORF Transcript_3/g.3 Transcript_3/m.3 type:complete len:615 (+) Transcript_3:321-2165(+)
MLHLEAPAALDPRLLRDVVAALGVLGALVALELRLKSVGEAEGVLGLGLLDMATALETERVDRLSWLRKIHLLGEESHLALVTLLGGDEVARRVSPSRTGVSELEGGDVLLGQRVLEVALLLVARGVVDDLRDQGVPRAHQIGLLGHVDGLDLAQGLLHAREVGLALVLVGRDLQLALLRQALTVLGDDELGNGDVVQGAPVLDEGVAALVEVDGGGGLGAHERGVDGVLVELGQVEHLVDHGAEVLGALVRVGGRVGLLEGLDAVLGLQVAPVDGGELLDLLVGHAGDELQLLGPDVAGAGEIEHLLAGGEDDHGGDLVAGEAEVLEALARLDHLVEQLVGALGDAGGGLARLLDVGVVLALEEDAVGEEHLDVVDGEHEAQVPAEEVHEHALGLDHVGPGGEERRLPQHPHVVLLHVVDEDQVVVDLVVLGGDQEAGDHHAVHALRLHGLQVLHALDLPVQEEAVHQLHARVQGALPLLELLAHLEDPLHQLSPHLQVLLGHAVLALAHLRGLDEVVELVPGLVLEHLGQQLGRRDVRVEVRRHGLDGRTRVLEDHGAAALAVLELDVVAHQRLAVDEGGLQVVGLVDVLGVRVERGVGVGLLALRRNALVV